MNSGARALLLAAVLGAAGALRHTAPTAPPKPATAMCVVGNAGTLPFSEMHKSLHKFMTRLNGTGLTRSDKPDMFTYVTLQGLEKNREGYGYLGQNTSYDQALYAIMVVGPVAYKIDQDAYEVTAKNVDQYIKNKETCFNNGVWQDSPRALRKSLNQLVQWQHCLKLVFHQERIVGKKYDVVVLARPDIAYKKDTEMDLSLVANAGRVYRQRDWIMVLPRKVAGGLMNKTKTKPLTCNPGEPCCGKVGSSEQLLEYLTGIGGTSFDSCNCGPKVEETGPIDQKTNLFIGRVINSGAVRGSDTVMLDVPFETVMTEHDGTELI